MTEDEMNYVAKNAKVQTAHGWDGENDYWYLILNGHYITVDKSIFDKVNHAMIYRLEKEISDND